MKLFIAGLLTLLSSASFAFDAHEFNKVVCYWNSTSFNRPGIGKFVVDDLRPALALCTHLIYGFAGINGETQEVVPLNPSLDTEAAGGYAFYRLVTQMKRSFPNVKFLLGIGGSADPDDTHKYVTTLESPESRTKLINTIGHLLDQYDFDGVDLAWQFPEVRAPKHRSTLSSWWHKFKKTLGFGKWKDDKEVEHRDGFSIMVRELKEQRLRNKAITVSVLPHVNSTIYYDVMTLQRYVDAVHLMAFDQKTPTRNPSEADYPAPIFGMHGRVAEDNVDVGVRYWLQHGLPSSKLVVVIPTFGRTWRLTAESNVTSIPPVVTYGPGPEGPQTKTPGLLSFPEICARLAPSAQDRLTYVRDPSKKYGSYAYQLYNAERGVDGVWVGYDDAVTAGYKTAYVKAKGLGGVGIFDLSLDDFQGSCTGYRFPILRAAKFML